MKTPPLPRRLLPAAALLLALAGCGTTNYPGTTSLSGDLPGKGPIVPDLAFNLTPSTKLPLEKLVNWGLYAGAAWLILDPLAPNWEIEQAAFPDQHYHLSLKMKRVYSGGAGEARAVFQRHARELMRQNGYDVDPAGNEIVLFDQVTRP